MGLIDDVQILFSDTSHKGVIWNTDTGWEGQSFSEAGRTQDVPHVEVMHDGQNLEVFYHCPTSTGQEGAKWLY